jgi:5-oxoprolinase (ATP-hydrolysing) subunit A
MHTDLNCDLGENAGTGPSGGDEGVMPWITSANIACGFHAGDPVTIQKTISLALKYGAGIGAHPGYPDRENFGRMEMPMDDDTLRAVILYQVGALKGMTEAMGGHLRHVKPHGALYNSAAVNRHMAEIIALAVRDIDKSLVLFGLSGSELERAAKKAGIAFAAEVFADRAYNDDGTLVPRSNPAAVIYDTKEVTARAIRMVKEKRVETLSGRVIPVNADTICIHGDNVMAAEFARSLVLAFREAGIEPKTFGA